MSNRRDFIKNSSLVGLGAVAAPNSFSFNFNNVNDAGIGLFSLPMMLEKDFSKTMEMLSTMGYKKIEFYGPYSFSAEKQKQIMAKVNATQFQNRRRKALADLYALLNGLMAIEQKSSFGLISLLKNVKATMDSLKTTT